MLIRSLRSEIQATDSTRSGWTANTAATKALLEAEATAVEKRAGVDVDYKFGTMIEIPRACWVADEIAQYAQFFSFGTNDLTQTCLGMSRDHSCSFLARYQKNEIIKKNPFASVDQTGVG